MNTACPAHSAKRAVAGSVIFTGYCYDHELRRCRVYAVSDGLGGMDWRVHKERLPGSREPEPDRRFTSYAEAMQWMA